MADEGTFAQWAIAGIATAGGSLILWLMNRSISRLDDDIKGHDETLTDHDRRISANQLDLASHRLHVSERYSTKDEAATAKVEMQHCLDRLHARIDSLPREIIAMFRQEKS